MTSWANEGLEDETLCGSDVNVVDQLSYVGSIVCLFCLITFFYVSTITWILLLEYN